MVIVQCDGCRQKHEVDWTIADNQEDFFFLPPKDWKIIKKLGEIKPRFACCEKCYLKVIQPKKI